MNFKEEHIALFDDFLSDSLTKEEKQSFESRLDSDQEFKREFKEYKLFVSGIEASFEQELLENIKQGEIKFQKRKLLIGLSIFMFLMVLIFSLIHLLKDPSSSHPSQENNKITYNSPSQSIESETKDTITKNENILEDTVPIVITSHNTISDPEKNIPTAKIDSQPLFEVIEFKRYDQITIFDIDGKLVIQSPEKITRVISFMRDRKEYLSILRTVYLKQGNAYKIAPNQRVMEGIARSSGKGKKQSFEVSYYQRLNKTPIKGDTIVESKIINGQIFQFEKRYLIANEIPEFTKTYSGTTTQRFFTVEDLMNLENNN